MQPVKSQAKWNSPRETIACKYKDNDFAYCEHGIFAAMQVYKLLDLPPSVTTEMTILDYGCGTGRQARALSSLFKKVVAYDPSPGCLEEFHKEIKQTERTYPNIEIVGDVKKIPVCDVGFSLHVIEHLDHEQSVIMIENMKASITGTTVLAYHAVKNAFVISPFLTPEQIVDDKHRAENEKRYIRMKALKLRT